MISVWVCDDSEKMAEIAAKYAERELERRRVDYELEIFNSEDVLKVFEDERRAPDILIIAVKLRSKDGVSISSVFKKAYCNTIIIFMSVKDSVLDQVLNQNPFGCINKRLIQSELPYFLDKALLKLESSSKAELRVRSKGINLSFPVEKILFLMSYNKQVIICTEDGMRFTVRDTIKRLTKVLEKYDFYLINRGILVNFSYVTKLKGNDLVLSCGESFSCSRDGKRIVKEKLPQVINCKTSMAML